MKEPIPGINVPPVSPDTMMIGAMVKELIDLAIRLNPKTSSPSYIARVQAKAERLNDLFTEQLSGT